MPSQQCNQQQQQHSLVYSIVQSAAPNSESVLRESTNISLPAIPYHQQQQHHHQQQYLEPAHAHSLQLHSDPSGYFVGGQPASYLTSSSSSSLSAEAEAASGGYPAADCLGCDGERAYSSAGGFYQSAASAAYGDPAAAAYLAAPHSNQQ